MDIKVYPEVTYTASSGQTKFTFPFDYLRKAFVKAKVNDTNVSNYSVTDKTINFDAALSSGDKVYIYRSTSTTRLVSWADASVMKANDLTLQQVQELHILEEQQVWQETAYTNTVKELRDIEEDISDIVPRTEAIRVATEALKNETATIKANAVSETTSIKQATLTQADTIINNAVAETTAIKNSAITETNAIKSDTSDLKYQTQVIKDATNTLKIETQNLRNATEAVYRDTIAVREQAIHDVGVVKSEAIEETNKIKTQAENNSKAIYNETVGIKNTAIEYSNLSRKWAEGTEPPDGVAGHKSSKMWAEITASYLDDALAKQSYAEALAEKVPVYSETKSYVPGDIVMSSDGNVFRCIAASIGENPLESTKWRKVQTVSFNTFEYDENGNFQVTIPGTPSGQWELDDNGDIMIKVE